MANRILGWIISLAGYLVYSLVVLICLLWFLFPSDTVKDWLELQLNTQFSGYEWTVDSLRLVFPGRLELTKIGLTPVGAGNTSLTIDRFSLAPDLQLLHGQKAFKYRLELLKGSVYGQILLTADGKQFESKGAFDGLHVKDFEILQQSLERTVDGILIGQYSGKGVWNTHQVTEFQGNGILAGGTLQFKAPVLGLTELPYTAIETDFRFHEGEWLFEQGKLQSVWMNGTFNGSIQTGLSLAASSLQLQGILTPRSEMFAGIENKQMAEVVRIHLKDGGLPFTVSGTVGEPGLLFAGPLSQALKGLSGGTN